jgi:hypothetical protein
MVSVRSCKRVTDGKRDIRSEGMEGKILEIMCGQRTNLIAQVRLLVGDRIRSLLISIGER